ncbi:MAG: LysR family transcriptional regulator [Arenimonas sp.]|nr:LysR family transcriptional regulator [Arenimonas sp.]
MRRLPSVNCMRSFETVARLGNFHRAAEQLHLTQSAVSHQIRVLEECLGTPVFQRIGKQVILTDPGKDFLQTVRQLLQQLNSGMSRLEQFSKPNQLIVNATPSFASLWLLPRLARFNAENPDIDVWLYSTDLPVRFEVAELHVSIREDLLPEHGLSVETLYQDAMTPMAAPMLHAVGSPEDIISQSLLHGEQKEDWSWWLSGVGAHIPAPTRGINFSDLGLSIQAASHGLGLVLGSRVLSYTLRENQQLIPWFPQAEYILPCMRSMLVQYRDNAPERPRIKKFVTWLHKEIDAMNCADPLYF